MKNYLLLLFLTTSYIATGQIKNKFTLPLLKCNDSIIILIKRNDYQEKVILTKNKSFTKIAFFKNTVVGFLNEEVEVSKRKKKKLIKLIKNFNDEFYINNTQIIMGKNKQLDTKYFKFKELFLLTEERKIYRTLKNLFFINPNEIVITDQHTDISITLNHKILSHFRVNWYLHGDTILLW